MKLASVSLVDRFSFKIIAGLVSMLFLVGIPFFVLFLRYHQSQLLETMENSTTNMGRILTHQIEASVLERRNHDLAQIVARLSESGDARKIMVINPDSRVVHSSDSSELGRIFSRQTEPGCRDCHSSLALKDTIYLKDAQGHPYYRTVTVIQNRPSCTACHDPRSAVNGILIMDFSQDTLQRQIRASMLRMLAMGGAMLALTIGVLFILLNQLVLRRLRRLGEAAEQIGQSKFKRVEMPGKDEFSQVAESFNLMSSRLETAMKEIRGSKDYLESIINNIDDEIIVLDRGFQIVTANAAHMRNWAGNELPGLGTGAEVRQESHEFETCACKHTFDDGQVHKVVQTAVGLDGKERYIEVFSSPLCDEANALHQVIEVRRDITERKLLEANLAHSEKLVSMGLLASGLSHEINNPLASISTFVEGLRRRLDGSGNPDSGNWDGLESSLGLIQREIERAKDVTRRLLILAQKDVYGPSLVNLNESLQETVMLVKYEASKRGIEITVEASSDMPTLKLSEAQTRQVFLNLLINSLHAGHPGGHVRCRTWLEDAGAFVSVEDDGSGIEAADQVRIFEPFFSKKESGQGTGLGLFISKSIISSWGGDIRVESPGGLGAKFTIWIPIPK
jgi:PAS domain S-box-containing protein